MKSESVSTGLVLLLFLSALFAVWLSVRWFFSVKEMQELQTQQTRINNTRAAAQSLANDVVQYARKNPKMEAVLAEFNLRPPATNQMQAPAGK